MIRSILLVAVCSLAVLLLIGACNRSNRGRVVLQKVDEAVAHPKAKFFTLRGQSIPDRRGIGSWEFRHPRSVGTNDLTGHEMWVVPVVDPGGELGDEVFVWLTPPGHIKAGDSPNAWVERLQKEFDGKELTLKVVARVANAPNSGWAKAIADVQNRHGLRSNPHAPILLFPSP